MSRYSRKIDEFVKFVIGMLKKTGKEEISKGDINVALKNEFGAQKVSSGDAQKVANVLKNRGVLNWKDKGYGDHYDVNT